uniref:Uncharacterized protein n=1 Tax=viral metagenome TaxID=1070528 RepID=A0A6C0ICN3_9ZZZZ
MRFLPLLFQIILYRGSHVPRTMYDPLVGALQQRLVDINATVSVQPYGWFRRRTFSEPSVILGHSFGGYFALQDAPQKNVQGIVLLNSHFNSRRPAWYYPGIDQEKVDPPVLVVAGGQDERLPLKHILSDLWEKIDVPLARTFYQIYPEATHFSTLQEKQVVDDIEVFVRGIVAKNLAPIQKRCQPSETRFGYFPLSQMVPRGRDFTRSVDLVDGLLKIFLQKNFWTWLHHIAFLLQTPNEYQNFVYTDYGDHILIKACNLSPDEIKRLCRTILPEHYSTSLKIQTVSPTLLGLYQWLLLPLVASNDMNSTVKWPILHLPVRENVDYYKILHPRQIILKALESSKST